MRTTELRQRIAACLAVIGVSVLLAVGVFSFNARADSDEVNLDTPEWLKFTVDVTQ